MRYFLLFVTTCVNFSWCIFNIERHKGLPLVKTAAQLSFNSAGTENRKVQLDFPSSTKLSNSDINNINNPQNNNGESPVIVVDDQTIDDFNNFQSKNVPTMAVKEDSHSAMAMFFEKMSLFQMIMQASMEAIINRVADLETSIASNTKKDYDSSSTIEREEVSKDEKMHSESDKTIMPEEVAKEFLDLAGVEIDPKDAVPNNTDPNDAYLNDYTDLKEAHPKDPACVEDPKSDINGPEKFIIDNFVDISNAKKNENVNDDTEEYFSPRSGFDNEASLDNLNLLDNYRKEDAETNKLSKKANIIVSPTHLKKNHKNLITKPNREKENNSHSFSDQVSEEITDSTQVVHGYESHNRLMSNNPLKNDDTNEHSVPLKNDNTNEHLVPAIADDQSKTININNDTSFAFRNNSDLSHQAPVYYPPQTRNNLQTLNRSAFETDRSRENPRLQYKIMKFQRRSNHQMTTNGSDYDCIDDDGIDCLGVADDDYDKARKLDKLTKKDNFRARTIIDDFNLDEELINIENAERKLEELVRQTAMIGELQELLEILKNFKPGCPYNVPSVKVGERCFSVELTHLTFNQARQFCKARGGTLAQEPLNAFLWSQIARAYPEHDAKEMWVGAHDERGEGRFTFVNGQEISNSDNRWEPNSPSYSSSSHCLAIDGKRGLSFKDRRCDLKYHFICEFPLTSLV